MAQQLFDFSKRERIGILVFVALITLATVTNFFFKKRTTITNEIDQGFALAIEEAYQQKEIAQLEKKKRYTKSKKRYTNSSKKYKTPKSPTTVRKEVEQQSSEQPSSKVLSPFEFNPNTIDKSDLELMGIPSKVVNIMMNYRKKGGQFFSKKDFKKIYGVTDELYSSLEEFIVIPQKKVKPKQVKTIKKIDMNLADGPTWDRLYGINRYLSNKILDYREELGGFIKKEQLTEIEQMPDSIYQVIEKYMEINSNVSKKNINSISFKELKSHPYISKKLAGRIITFIDRNGNFKDFNEFENFLKITPKELSNIKAYFIIQ